MGYGDLTPTSQSGRAFTSVYALCGAALIGNILGYFGEKVADQRDASMTEAAAAAEDRLMKMFSRRRESSRRLGQANADREMQSLLKTAGRRGIAYAAFARDNWVFLPLLFLFSLGSYAEIAHDQGGTFIDAVYYTVATLTTVRNVMVHATYDEGADFVHTADCLWAEAQPFTHAKVQVASCP